MNLFLSTLFFALPVWAWTPSPVDTPDEDFSYTCTIGLSQQFRDKNNGCYAEFEATKIISSVDSDSRYGDLPIISATDLQFKKIRGDDNCGSEPKVNKQNTFAVLGVYENKGGGFRDGQFETSLYVRVADAQEDLLTSDARTTAPFSEGYVEVSGSLSTKKLNLDISVSCVKATNK